MFGGNEVSKTHASTSLTYWQRMFRLVLAFVLMVSFMPHVPSVAYADEVSKTPATQEHVSDTTDVGGVLKMIPHRVTRAAKLLLTPRAMLLRAPL